MPRVKHYFSKATLLSLIFSFSFQSKAEVCRDRFSLPAILSTIQDYNRALSAYEKQGPGAFVEALRLTKLDSAFMIERLKGLPRLPALSWKENEFWLLKVHFGNKTAVIDFCNASDDLIVINGNKFKYSRKLSLQELSEVFEPMTQSSNTKNNFLFWIQNQIWPSAHASIDAFAIGGAFLGLIAKLFFGKSDSNKSKSTAGQYQYTPPASLSGGHMGSGVPSGGGSQEAIAPSQQPATDAGSGGNTPIPQNQGAGSPSGSGAPGGALTPPQFQEGATKCPPENPSYAANKMSEENAALDSNTINNFLCFSMYYEFSSNNKNITQWNPGPREDMLSLGIGHYIWYPKTHQTNFTESFPKLIQFACANGYKNELPKELGFDGEKIVACPWNSKEQFDKDKEGEHAANLRKFLLDEDMKKIQVHFQYARLEAFIKNLETQSDAESKLALEMASILKKEPAGLMAMMDYVNFKGEGTDPNETYTDLSNQKQFWGLKQVLANMKSVSGPRNNLGRFIESAKIQLHSRLYKDIDFCKSCKNSDDRDAKRQLLISGWNKRLEAYSNITNACGS